MAKAKNNNDIDAIPRRNAMVPNKIVDSKLGDEDADAYTPKGKVNQWFNDIRENAH